MPLAELIDLRKGQEGGCGGRGLTGERVTGGEGPGLQAAGF